MFSISPHTWTDEREIFKLVRLISLFPSASHRIPRFLSFSFNSSSPVSLNNNKTNIHIHKKTTTFPCLPSVYFGTNALYYRSKSQSISRTSLCYTSSLHEAFIIVFSSSKICQGEFLAKMKTDFGSIEALTNISSLFAYYYTKV